MQTTFIGRNPFMTPVPPAPPVPPVEPPVVARESRRKVKPEPKPQRIPKPPRAKPFKAKATDPRIIAYSKRCDLVYRFVIAHPLCKSSDIAADTGFKLDRVCAMLYDLTGQGRIARVVNPLGLNNQFVYGPPGSVVDTDYTPLVDRIYEFVKANPGTTRGPILRHAGASTGGTSLCALVKRGLIRFEGDYTGTHYYIED